MDFPTTFNIICGIATIVSLVLNLVIERKRIAEGFRTTRVFWRRFFLVLLVVCLVIIFVLPNEVAIGGWGTFIALLWLFSLIGLGVTTVGVKRTAIFVVASILYVLIILYVTPKPEPYIHYGPLNRSYP